MKIIINLGREILLLGSVRGSIMKPSETSSGKKLLYYINNNHLDNQFFIWIYRVSQNQRIPSRGSCREKSQESRKNKIKNIRGVFTKIYGSEGSNFSSCFLQIKHING
jgi:hypothetical protein